MQTINNYNGREHRELPKKSDGKHYTPAEYYDYRISKLPTEKRPQFLSTEEMEMMYRPQEKRTVERGWVRFLNKHYFHMDLAVYDGQKVHIAYDWDDPKDVIVYDLDGRYICKALLNGNTVPAFDVPSVTKQMEEIRVRNQIKRLENKALQARESLGGGIIEHMPDFGKMVIPDAANEHESLSVQKTGTDDAPQWNVFGIVK